MPQHSSHHPPAPGTNPTHVGNSSNEAEGLRLNSLAVCQEMSTFKQEFQITTWCLSVTKQHVVPLLAFGEIDFSVLLLANFRSNNYNSWGGGAKPVDNGGFAASPTNRFHYRFQWILYNWAQNLEDLFKQSLVPSRTREFIYQVTEPRLRHSSNLIDEKNEKVSTAVPRNPNCRFFRS